MHDRRPHRAGRLGRRRLGTEEAGGRRRRGQRRGVPAETRPDRARGSARGRPALRRRTAGGFPLCETSRREVAPASGRRQSVQADPLQERASRAVPARRRGAHGPGRSGQLPVVGRSAHLDVDHGRRPDHRRVPVRSIPPPLLRAAPPSPWTGFALGAACLVTYAWHGFPQPPSFPTPAHVDLLGNTIFALAALGLLASVVDTAAPHHTLTLHFEVREIAPDVMRTSDRRQVNILLPDICPGRYRPPPGGQRRPG